MSNGLKSILAIGFLFGFFQTACGEELIQAPLAIHITSKISDGKYTIPQIIAIARKNNIKVVVITDRDLMRWEYGIWPLRNVIRKVVQQYSIFKFGISRYLKQVADAQKMNPDVLLIPGQESAPFYYWQGSILKNNLKLCDWHKHILAIGLDSVGDYRDLPLAGNARGLKTHFQLYALWPIVLVFIGFFFLRARPIRPRYSLLLIIVGLLFFINNWPFYGVKYDQYHGDSGIIPYQNFIDYAEGHGGLTFWAHPDVENIEKIGRVSIETREHGKDLLTSHDYTGFAIFYEGYKEVGRPGGIWDEVLREYCQGARKKPVWTIGGLAFDSDGDLGDYMKDLRNMLLLSVSTKAEALKAMREGRMYVIRGRYSSEFILDKFIVRDNAARIEKTLGQEISLAGLPQIEIRGRFLHGQNQPMRIRLIKDGNIIKTFETATPFDISYQDEYGHNDRKTYYRIEAESDGVFLITNPIFVLTHQ